MKKQNFEFPIKWIGILFICSLQTYP